MVDKTELFILVTVVILLVVFFYPDIFNVSLCSDQNGRTEEGFVGSGSDENVSDSAYSPVSPSDPNDQSEREYSLTGSDSTEPVIYDYTTGTVMSGSEFMHITGVIAPAWIPPAWDNSAFGEDTGDLTVEDQENDPRMLYNKCSLACCSSQYPVPFDADKDPFACDKDGNSKYLPSNYTCTNNTGTTGCLCVTPKQAGWLGNGFANTNN